MQDPQAQAIIVVVVTLVTLTLVNATLLALVSYAN